MKISRKDVDGFIGPYRIEDGSKFRLKDFDPASTGGLKSKDRAKELLALGIEQLSAEQDKLYADDRNALLLVFQAMDAAGKDGTIKHVMSGVNPQGCQVYSFKSPSAEELDHDYLWRTMKCVPEKGRIGIFNRSYYEEVLVVRVHPEILAKQHLPSSLVTKKIWEERFEDIVNFERYLHRNGVKIRKFFLNVSHAEQKRRFLARLDDPDKEFGRYHALDLYTILATTSETEWREAVRFRDQRAEDPYIMEAGNLVSKHFSALDRLGMIRLRESRYYRLELQLAEFMSALQEVFPSKGETA